MKRLEVGPGIGPFIPEAGVILIGRACGDITPRLGGPAACGKGPSDERCNDLTGCVLGFMLETRDMG